MDAVAQLKVDLPVTMTMAAFVGISWYICVEINIRLFLTFRRRNGLYYWSCLLCSWGVLTQPLAIILADFGVWKDHLAAIVIIYLSWWAMVVPQSFVLYSRLYLVMSNTTRLRWVLYVIIGVTVVFSFPTIIIGILAQTSMKASLGPPYLIWDKIQLTVFFVQETVLSLLYIVQTRKHLKSSSMLHHDDKSSRDVFNHLIWVNVLVIFLDCSLLALSYANFFYVQSAYKPCVYGVKLRVEFAILNKLIATVQRSSKQSYTRGVDYKSSGWRHNSNEARLETFSCRSERSGARMINGGSGVQNESLDLAPYGENGIVQTTEISVRPLSKAATPDLRENGETWQP
ncbi:hypothetical protein BDV96DRAFT_504635 [Lophiotrema nucula]|uniref:DUF7703 domain-containing protein n=1 Tax=Lophiotrema nucula TaxID=690887 RepID=A0A6A5YPQ6_9PLEO|nr:hypothetical protein BDV96DRAFT_504635 [Lophiotrema nucula]